MTSSAQLCSQALPLCEIARRSGIFLSGQRNGAEFYGYQHLGIGGICTLHTYLVDARHARVILTYVDTYIRM